MFNTQLLYIHTHRSALYPTITINAFKCGKRAQQRVITKLNGVFLSVTKSKISFHPLIWFLFCSLIVIAYLVKCACCPPTIIIIITIVTVTPDKCCSIYWHETWINTRATHTRHTTLTWKHTHIHTYIMCKTTTFTAERYSRKCDSVILSLDSTTNETNFLFSPYMTQNLVFDCINFNSGFHFKYTCICISVYLFCIVVWNDAIYFYMRIVQFYTPKLLNWMQYAIAWLAGWLVGLIKEKIIERSDVYIIHWNASIAQSFSLFLTNNIIFIFWKWILLFESNWENCLPCHFTKFYCNVCAHTAP